METETPINGLIREQMTNLNGSFEKREVAQKILPDLSDEQMTALAIEGLMGRMRSITSMMRPAVRLSKQSAPSGRWDQVREARDILDDFWVGFEDRPGKRLLDCSAEDCVEAAEGYRYRAETNAARAEAFKKLAGSIRKSKVERVGELDRDVVRRLLDA